MICDVCEKKFPKKNAIVSLSVLVKDDPGAPEQMYPYKAGKIYNICFPCWLRSMGVKP